MHITTTSAIWVVLITMDTEISMVLLITKSRIRGMGDQRIMAIRGADTIEDNICLGV